MSGAHWYYRCSRCVQRREGYEPSLPVLCPACRDWVDSDWCPVINVVKWPEPYTIRLDVVIP